MEDDGVGVDFKEYITNKYGPAAAERFLKPNSQLDMTASKVGIQFKKDRKIFPSRRAHVLMEYIKSVHGDTSDEANSIMTKLFQMYFEDGLNPNSLDTLRTIVQDVLGKKDNNDSDDAVEKALNAAQDEELLKDVLQKDSYHKYQGVSGVPYFIIEKATQSEDKGSKRQPVTFSGAYPPDFIAQELEEMASD